MRNYWGEGETGREREGGREGERSMTVTMGYSQSAYMQVECGINQKQGSNEYFDLFVLLKKLGLLSLTSR